MIVMKAIKYDKICFKRIVPFNEVIVALLDGAIFCGEFYSRRLLKKRKYQYIYEAGDHNDIHKKIIVRIIYLFRGKLLT